MLNIILAVLATLVIVAPVTYLITTNYQKKNANSKISNAEEQARAIIDEALVAAETKKREGLLEIKEESIRLQIDDQTKTTIELSKNAIAMVVKEEETKPAEK